jgi:hypothetical protein
MALKIDKDGVPRRVPTREAPTDWWLDKLRSEGPEMTEAIRLAEKAKASLDEAIARVNISEMPVMSRRIAQRERDTREQHGWAEDSSSVNTRVNKAFLEDGELEYTLVVKARLDMVPGAYHQPADLINWIFNNRYVRSVTLVQK